MRHSRSEKLATAVLEVLIWNSLGPKKNIWKCKPNIQIKCQLEKPCNPCVKFIQWTIMHNVIFLTPFLSSPITLGFCMLLNYIYFLMMAIFVLSHTCFKFGFVKTLARNSIYGIYRWNSGRFVLPLYLTSSVLLRKSTKTCVWWICMT